MIPLNIANKVCRRTEMNLRYLLLPALMVATLSHAEENMAANETAAAAACKAFAEGEEIYHRTDYYADALAPERKADMRSGLLMQPDGTEIALVDRAFANAECPLGTDPKTITPKAGYLFRVLTKQKLPVERDFIRGGNMTLGYAFIA